MKQIKTTQHWTGATIHGIRTNRLEYRHDGSGRITWAHDGISELRVTNRYGDAEVTPAIQKQKKQSPRAHLDHMRVGRNKY